MCKLDADSIGGWGWEKKAAGIEVSHTRILGLVPLLLAKLAEAATIIPDEAQGQNEQLLQRLR